MKNILLIFALFFLSCNIKDDQSIIITKFPIKKNLNAEIVKVPPIILSPANIFISNDKLLLFNPRQDTVFNMFELPQISHIKNLGLRGDGPNDFHNIDRRLFIPTERGFKLFFQAQNTLKEVSIQNNKINVHNDANIHFDIQDFPVNGFLPLNDSIYTYWSGFDQETEFTLLNTTNNTTRLFSPYPDWDNSQSSDEDRIFTYIKNSVVKSDGKQFASFYGYFKRFRIYDNEGKLLKDVYVDIPPYEESTTGKREIRTISYYAYPKTVNNYIYVFYQNRDEAGNKVTDLQVWKWDGSPVASYSLNVNLSLFTISEKYKKIYAINTSEENHEDVIFIYDLPFI